MKKLTLLFAFLSLFILQISAQCYIDVLKPTSDTTICAGDSVHLLSDGSCTFLMNNSFDNSTIGAGWSSTAANPVFTNPCGPGPNSWHLWVGTTPSQNRTLVTNSYDVSSTSCVVKWWMRYGRVSGAGNCEDPDEPDEGVHLQYSTNGGTTWTDFPGPNLDPVGTNSTTGPFTNVTNTVGSGGYWQPVGVPPSPPSQSVYYWHQYENSVPAAAATTNTRFRWAQLATSNQGYDAWGIDEVEIYCPGQQNVAWSHGDTTFDGGWVSPTSTTTYTVFILDTSGNSASANVKITVIPEVDPGLGPDTTICKNPGNYAILEADSGYDTYQWSTGASTQAIQVANSGTYYCTATKGNCIGTDSVTVTVMPAPVANAGMDQEICIGDTATLAASPVNGFYIWSTGDSTQSAIVAPQNDTTYYLTVGTAANCVSYDTINITVHPLPNADAGADAEICRGEQVNLTASGGQQYEWSTGDMVADITVSPTSTTSYTVTVTDVHSCVFSDMVTVMVNPLPSVEATSADSAICLGADTELEATGASFFEWSNGMTGQKVTVMPMSSTTYTVTGIDDKGCKNTASTTVIAEDCSTFYIPNAFTPDADGVNDTYAPLGDFAAFDDYMLTIYNRWGDLIFKTEDPEDGWDGMIDGEPAPAGVYVYHVYFRSIWGKEFDKTGSVTLLR